MTPLRAGEKPPPSAVIREYEASDVEAVRRCIVELQEFERAIDSRLRPGELIADEYWSQVQRRCTDRNGCVFVAEIEAAVVGFVAVLAEEQFTELDDPPGRYALVTDLMVVAPFRGRGIGRRLIERAEAFARSAGVGELRIGVLSANQPARQLYLSAGFAPHLEIFTKPL